METRLGNFSAQHEHPDTIKFAFPIVVLGDLFATSRHLNALTGYLATIGWEVYAPDLRSLPERAPDGDAHQDLAHLLQAASDAVAAVGRELILTGHGLGGLLALKLATLPMIKAAVAFAPLIPGNPYPAISRWQMAKAAWLGRAKIPPPAPRAIAMVLDGVEPYQHAALARIMVPESLALITDLTAGRVHIDAKQAAAPRLLIAGERDQLVALENSRRFAESIGSAFRTIPARGHWLIGGRALERTVGEAHRFVVRELGQDLLLLYPDEWKIADPADREGGSEPGKP